MNKQLTRVHVLPDFRDPTSKNYPHLTLAMIVRDGGQLFASLLEAAAIHVDEIVIGDTGSRDQSRHVAISAGAVVLDVPWTDDFAAARNTVLEQCTGRWILVLDADEQLAPGDWREIRNWAAEGDPQSDPVAASITTRNYLPGRHSQRSWQPCPEPDPHALPGGNPASGFVTSAKVRLIPNRPDIRFTGHLHETVETSLRTAGIPVVHLDTPIHHFGMLPEHQSEQMLKAKAKQYLKLARRKASANPHLPCAWAELADCSIACGNHEQALQAIDRALILSPLNADYRLTAGSLLKDLGRLEEADRQLSAAAGSGTVCGSLQAEIAHLRAQIAMLTDRLDQVGPQLSLALRLVPDNGHFFNTLGCWHLQAGRGEEARQALEKAHALCPETVDPLLNLGLLYEASGLPDQAEQVYRQALALDPSETRTLQAIQKLESRAALIH